MRRSFCCLLWVLFGCASNGASEPAAQANARCSGSAPDYESAVAPVVRRYCLECHDPGGSAGEEHDFTKIEVLRAQRKRVERALLAKAMPPKGAPQPSDGERALLTRWACP